jgi:hypothetical protein
MFFPMIDPQDDVPPADEIEMGHKGLSRKSYAGKPQEYVEPLTRRITYLENLLQRHVDRLERESEWSQFDRDAIESIRRDLQEAVQQFRDWHIQHEGRN